MKSKLRMGAMAVAAIVIAMVAYAQIAQILTERRIKREAVQQQQDKMAVNSVGAESLLKTEYISSSISYAEFFDKAAERNKSIDSAITAAQATKLDPDSKVALLEYGQALEETLRSQSMYTRKRLAVSNAQTISSARWPISPALPTMNTLILGKRSERMMQRRKPKMP